MPAVRLERPEPHVALLTLDRPERLNAINTELVDGVLGALEEVRWDRSVRVVVLTGAGRAFCAGADLRDGVRVKGTEDAGRVVQGMATQERIAAMMIAIDELPQPVIAAVNGAAVGGGLTLALASDVRLAGRSARFGAAFIKIGLSGCDMGSSYMLPKAVGTSHAYELLLTGRVIDATEAERINLVSRVVPDDELLDAAFALATEMQTNSPFGLVHTKRVMRVNASAASLRIAMALEDRTQILGTFTEDSREAVAAFLEKRPPQFDDR